MQKLFPTLVAIFTASSALAQTAIPTSPVMVQQPVPIIAAPSMQPYATAVLPANTVVNLTVNDTITTKGKRWNEGDNFDLTVSSDVRLAQYVVIPRGARASGRITWLTNKGAFGKSGKLEFDIEYVEVGGRRIPLSGNYRQEGEGNTVGTIAGVVAVGVLAGFVTGKSGVIPRGRELSARTKEDVPVALAAPYQSGVQAQQVFAAPAPMVQAVPAPAVLGSEQVIVVQPVDRSRTKSSQPLPKRFGNARVRCDTCQR